MEQIKDEKILEWDKFKNVLNEYNSEEQYEKLCFKNKIQVRQEHKPITNFRVEDWNI